MMDILKRLEDFLMHIVQVYLIAFLAIISYGVL